ncbi:hypothetical protein LTR28_011951, partial [Elasticomyces elasticus]
MACKLGPRKWEESFLPSSEDLEDLENEWECCGPLLRIDHGRGSPTVNIIHQSVKDFLMGTEIQRTHLLKYHVREDMAHLALFRVCWDFLCKTDFDQFSSKIVSKNDMPYNWGKAQNTYWEEVEKGETIFLSYTARAWDEHAIGAGNVVCSAFHWVSDWTNTRSELLGSWIRTAARNGQGAVVRLLLEKGADADSKDSKGHTPLSEAAEEGHEAVVRLLLEMGANAESKDSKDQTPLLMAADKGHEA